MTKMLGSDAILRSLEAEGVEVAFGIPGGAILPTYDAIARGTTVRHVLARHEQGAGHMAEGYARASGRTGVAIATSGPGRDQPRHGDCRRLDGLDAARLRHRAGPRRADRQRRLPGDRHHRHHPADRQALLARAGRRGAAAGDEGRVPRRLDRPLRPRARRRDEGRAGGRDRLPLPRRARSRRLASADQGASAPGARRGCGDPRGEAADLLRRRRRPERRRDPRAARARRAPAGAGRRDADGEERAARQPSAELRLARHARLEVRELGVEQVRPDHRRGLALRRPRHRQGVRIRTGREGDPFRHRRRRGGEDPQGRDPGRRPAQARAEDAHRPGALAGPGRPAAARRVARPARRMARGLPVPVHEEP